MNIYWRTFQFEQNNTTNKKTYKSKNRQMNSEMKIVPVVRVNIAIGALRLADEGSGRPVSTS